jgi:ADP-dependent NAD(P)H-hydrate dehydratase / NAD(P)H-hydrate epimerase
MFLPTAEHMREADRQAIEDHHIPSLFLMENAGQAAFHLLEKLYTPLGNQHVLIVVGKGNNGGDGLVIARLLSERSVSTHVLLLTPAAQLKGDALINYERLEGRVICEEVTTMAEVQAAVTPATVIVDGILGTGLQKPVTDFFAQVIEILNQSHKPIVALDIPSGLSAESGQPLGTAIQASQTIAFGAPKLGEVLREAEPWVGDLQVVDIGIPPEVMTGLSIPTSWVTVSEIKPHLPTRSRSSHKGTYGHVLVVAGSVNKLGAALLTAKAALHSGAGLVTLALPDRAFDKVPQDALEVMYEPMPSTEEGLFSEEALVKVLQLAEGKSVMAIGPGIGVGSGTQHLVTGLIQQSSLPLIIDADGLNNIADSLEVLEQATGPLVLTPHPGEMARLNGQSTQEIQKDRLQVARDWVQRYATYLVLKGDQTLTATPEGQVFLNASGNPAMAAAGMGDVLTGIIAAMMAQQLPLPEAVITGVFLHGLAGDLFQKEVGDRGLLASELLTYLPKAIHTVQHS